MPLSPEELARVPAIRVQRFWTEFVPDNDKPGEMKALDWVEWVKIGDSRGSTTNERIDRLRKGNAIEWQVIGPAYEGWKKTNEIPEFGTPLAAWPGADRALVDALAKVNIRTIEDFATAGRGAFAGIPVPDIARRQRLAEDFLLAQGATSITAAELAKRDKVIADQGADIKELRDQIAQLMAAQPERQAA